MARIVHIAIKVEDIEKSRAFYERVFGFTHTGTKRAGPLKDHMSCWLTDGGFGLTLIKYDNEDAPEASIAGKGPCIHHFGIAVAPEELESYIESVRKAGCDIISEPGVIPMKFRTPDGVVAEVGPPEKFPL